MTEQTSLAESSEECYRSERAVMLMVVEHNIKYTDSFIYLFLRGDLGDVGLDGRIIIKSMLKKYGVRIWTVFIWLGIGAHGRIFGAQ
jgi:hypothetical protein